MATAHDDQPVGQTGRIKPGTRIAVRELDDEEYAKEIERLANVNDGLQHSEPVEPLRWAVVWADHPEKGLYSWFSLVGGHTREEAMEQAEHYAIARGAEIVELPDE